MTGDDALRPLIGAATVTASLLTDRHIAQRIFAAVTAQDEGQATQMIVTLASDVVAGLMRAGFDQPAANDIAQRVVRRVAASRRLLHESAGSA